MIPGLSMQNCLVEQSDIAIMPLNGVWKCNIGCGSADGGGMWVESGDVTRELSAGQGTA